MRLFGLSEANAMVPMLVDTFTRIRAQLSKAGEPDASELPHELAAELESLEAFGIEVKAVDGLVDFRARRSGEIVYLCWRFPEDSIRHWHRVDTGFSGRRPIRDIDGFADSCAN